MRNFNDTWKILGTLIIEATEMLDAENTMGVCNKVLRKMERKSTLRIRKIQLTPSELSSQSLQS